MGNFAIRVENLSKRYRIGAKDEMQDTFVGAALSYVKKPLQSWRQLRKLTRFDDDQLSDDVIWALKDVSFEVKRGEVVGVIGRNGAGKSTLLKLLSRITYPTSGCYKIMGRVSSLLEVGTGFHPELSGRENIYLNGTILGMTKAEVDQKFDEILDFSGVEKFIDTPVKRYSSGMAVRLAFSVAAHLEPEILLVDEVLAVGDAEFQKKCLGKMGQVAEGGRTVLFVSHNMIAVRNLCERTILLQDGSIISDGDTIAITEKYLQQSLRVDSIEDVKNLVESLPRDPAFRLHNIEIRQDGAVSDVVVNGKPVEVEIEYSVLQRTTGLRVYFDLLYDHDILIRSFHDGVADAIPTMEPGKYISIAKIPANLLAPRRYDIRVRGTIFNVRSCTGDGIRIPLTAEASSIVNRSYPQDTIRSKLQPLIPWQTEKIIT
jgi:lipopolysaccharide transport system ATP-binding protein